MMNRARDFLFVVILAALASACSPRGASDEAAADRRPHPPVVKDGLVFTWLEEGVPRVATTVAEVPEAARAEVRVQDPSVPPERRDPSWVFLADLRQAAADGGYPVRVVARDEWEAKRHPAAAPSPPAPSATPSGEGAVVMYSTKHCPVCQKARRFLLAERIPFVERDVEESEAAARELAEKGRAQGVPTSGVPIFEIGGRLLPGFDEAALRQAWRAAAASPVTQI